MYGILWGLFLNSLFYFKTPGCLTKLHLLLMQHFPHILYATLQSRKCRSGMMDRSCKGFKTGWHLEDSLPAVVYYSNESKEEYRSDKSAIRSVFSWLQGLSLNLPLQDLKGSPISRWIPQSFLAGQVSPFTWASNDDWVINRTLSIQSHNNRIAWHSWTLSR